MITLGSMSEDHFPKTASKRMSNKEELYTCAELILKNQKIVQQEINAAIQKAIQAL
jgi:hypothetical protein